MTRPAPALALALALALASAGCAFLRGEGEESLGIRNDDVQPLTAVVSITQHEGQFQVFGESMTLASGQAREFAIALRPGAHTVSVTTSTRIDERVVAEIPGYGDTRIDVRFYRGGATVTTTSA